MGEVSFTGLALVVAAGAAAPLLAGLVPRLRVPAVVLEILLGILIGPVFGWVEVDTVISVMSLLGLALLLFLAGLEIDARALHGPTLRLAGAAYAVSLALGAAVDLGLWVVGLVGSPLLVAVILVTTGLGVILPILADAGQTRTEVGRLVIVAASIAEFTSIILLTLLFSEESSGTGTRLLLLGVFALSTAVLAALIAGVERTARLSSVLVRLQDTTAQIRVSLAVLLMIVFTALAAAFGLEVILGAFVAGAVVALLDRDDGHTHPHFRRKLEEVGYGVFVPVFFVTTGLRFDLDALLTSGETLAMIPVFVVAMLVVRGLPAVLYRRRLGTRPAAAAGLLQATTSVAFLVAAIEIGRGLGLIPAGIGAALVTAGLVSVVVFPLLSLGLLRGGPDVVPAGSRDAPT
jgi:Kef-type K+ transport system membrane component KefB